MCAKHVFEPATKLQAVRHSMFSSLLLPQYVSSAASATVCMLSCNQGAGCLVTSPITSLQLLYSALLLLYYCFTDDHISGCLVTSLITSSALPTVNPSIVSSLPCL